MKIFSHQVLLKPTKKPQLHGLALAFQNPKLGQSHYEAVFAAQLGLAYLGLAWPGSRPQARPGTALFITLSMIRILAYAICSK